MKVKTTLITIACIAVVLCEDIKISLPFDCTLEAVFDGGIYKTENKVLKYRAENGKTKMFIKL